MEDKFRFSKIVTQNKDGGYRELQYKSQRYDLVVTEINDMPEFAHMCDRVTSESVTKIAENNGHSMFDKLMIETSYLANFIQDQVYFNPGTIQWKIYVGPGRREIGGDIEDLEAILDSTERLRDLYDAIKEAQDLINNKYGLESYGEEGENV